MSIFFELLVLDVLISCHCAVNYEAGLFLVVDQRDVRQIVKQMLVSLDEEVLEDLGVIIRNYFFSGFIHQFLLCSRFYSAHIILYTFEATLFFSVIGPCELAAAADDMRHGLCMSFAQPTFGIMHSVVDHVCHCPGVEGQLLSSHDQSIDVRFDVAFIEPLICAGHVCNF